MTHKKSRKMHDILIVDDQSYMQDLLAFELTDKSYTLISAENIDKARTYLETFTIDLVVLDLYINGFHCWDLLKEIKHKHPGLPVVIVTAYDNFINDPRAIQADAYLIKNFKNIDLVSHKVRELLS